jgi:hypothetical protein
MRLSPVPIGIGMGVCGGACYRELPRILHFFPRTGVAIDVGEMLKRRTVDADGRAREAMARSGVSRI